MNGDDLRIGDVVQSKAGRDKGKYFMVYSIVDGDFILVADGVLRKQINPKKKRKKHVRAVEGHLGNIARKIGEGLHVFDAEIRKALDESGYGNQAIATKKEG